MLCVARLPPFLVRGRAGGAALVEADGSPSFSDKNPVGALGFVAKAGQPLRAGAPSCDDWQNTANQQLGNIDIYDAYSNGEGTL